MSHGPAENPPLFFEALIVPYRSLTPRGVSVLIGVLTFLVALVIARFWFIGAWPVVVFSVLEVPLVVLLLLLNIRRARASEMILLDACDVTVIRTDQTGRQSRVSLPAAWLRIDHDPGGNGSRLMLRSRESVLEIGAFLHEPDRRALSDALRGALHKIKNPRFDNPQLRDAAQPDQGSAGPIDLMRSNTRLRIDGSVIR